MTPKDIAKILHEILTPLQDKVSALESTIQAVSSKALDPDVTKAELKTFMVERASEERDRLLRDREAFRGEPGKTGLPGKDGQRGDSGKAGGRGERGLPGRDGKDGREGIDGKDGRNGFNGRDGQDGLPGTQGKRGDVGGTGKQGVPGERGLTGFMKAVEPWRKREHQALEVVSCGGALWQARRLTSSEPSFKSNGWEALSVGVGDIDWQDVNGELKMTIALTDGETRTSPNMRGEKGAPGESQEFAGDYDNTRMYRKGLDIVKENGSSWLAIKSGILQKPGSDKGKGSWICIAHKGPKGDTGESASVEQVMQRVLQEMRGENAALIENIVKQVDDYFASLDG